MENDIITDIRQTRVSGYSELTVKGKALYRAKCAELIDEGELRKGHLPSLILWADCYDRYWQLRHELDDEGYTFETQNKFGQDVISANPKVKMMNDAMKTAIGLQTEFGATLKQSRKLGKMKKTDNPLEEWEK
jgi:Phage terminase, small subunit.